MKNSQSRVPVTNMRYAQRGLDDDNGADGRRQGCLLEMWS